MLKSKTLDDLLEAYRSAKTSGDALVIGSAEAAISHFSQAEAAMVSMRVSEALTAKATGFTLKG